MSHYQDNIIGPRFPPGGERAHYSLANTTLVGLERKHRLWSAFWRRHYDMFPAPYYWYNHAMLYGQNPYSAPNALPTLTYPSQPIPLNQVSSEGLERRPENNGVIARHRPCVTSKEGRDVIIEVVDEGGSVTGKQRRRSKRQDSVKTVDPVTDDLNWEQFSPNLADGIAVSILDSFATELPALEHTDVQTALDKIEGNLPHLIPQTKQLSGKEEFFAGINDPERQTGNISDFSLDDIMLQPTESWLSEPSGSIEKQGVDNYVTTQDFFTVSDTSPGWFPSVTGLPQEGLTSLLRKIDVNGLGGIQPHPQLAQTGFFPSDNTSNPECQTLMEEMGIFTDLANYNNLTEVPSLVTPEMNRFDLPEDISTGGQNVCDSFCHSDHLKRDSYNSGMYVSLPISDGQMFSTELPTQRAHINTGKHCLSEPFWPAPYLSNSSDASDTCFINTEERHANSTTSQLL